MVRCVQLFALALMLIAAQAASGADRYTALQRAMDRGRTMYLYDRAAWVATDDMLSRLPQNRQPEVGGWIVTGSAPAFRVDYFGKNAAADRVVYSAEVNGEAVSNRTVYPVNSEPALKEPALIMARALHAAWAEMARHPTWKPCDNARFNTIVLPPETDGTVSVYFLTPQTQADSFPFGGHYEVDIARDGRTVFTRAFTRSCITIDKQPPSNGAVPAGLSITHVLDPQPTEIHVFEQYYVGVPVYVATTDGHSLWKVERGKIEAASAMPTGAAAPEPQMFATPDLTVPPTARLIGIKAVGARRDLDRLQAFTTKSHFPCEQTDGPEGRELLIAFPPGSDSKAVAQFIDELRGLAFSALHFESVVVPAEK